MDRWFILSVYQSDSCEWINAQEVADYITEARHQFGVFDSMYKLEYAE